MINTLICKQMHCKNLHQNFVWNAVTKKRLAGNLQNAIIRKKKTAMFYLTYCNNTLVKESFFKARP